MISSLPLFSTSCNGFLDDPSILSFDEMCSSAIHFGLAFLPKQLNVIAVPIFTGLGILKIFTTPERGQKREENLTRFFANLSPISADLIGFYHLFQGLSDFCSSLLDFFYQEKETISLKGVKPLLMSAFTLFADYRFFKRCSSAQKERLREAKVEIGKMERNLDKTRQALDRTSQALGATIVDFRDFTYASGEIRRRLEEQFQFGKIDLQTARDALRRSQESAARNLRNFRALQGAMERNLDRFARRDAKNLHQLEEATRRISKLEEMLSAAIARSDAMGANNRRLNCLVELLAGALQRRKSSSSLSTLAFQHQQALRNNILNRGNSYSANSSSSHRPILLRENEMERLERAYQTNQKISIV